MDTSDTPGGETPKLAITSAFGDPRNRRTWSAAPANIAMELESLGFEVVGVDTSVRRHLYAACGALHLLSGYGGLRYSEAIARGPALRRHRAARLEIALRKQGLKRVIHTGTFDLPPVTRGGDIEHFLYCDSTWHLSLRYRPDASLYTRRAASCFDELEREAYEACSHVFTFANYVRDDLISHYGLPPEKVSVAGAGMGAVTPFEGEKDYTSGELLFIAKHLFAEKGGLLLLQAFAIAVAARPELRLTIVGGAPAQGLPPLPPNVTVRPFLTWDELAALQQRAVLLVQPMLNDPWGQVYLEAMLARTPVLGLNRNGLPEITEGGRCGFLVEEATPEAIAHALLEALADPARLAEMGEAGQRHVRANYSWSRAAERMASVLRPFRPEEAAPAATAPDVLPVAAPAAAAEPMPAPIPEPAPAPIPTPTPAVLLDEPPSGSPRRVGES